MTTRLISAEFGKLFTTRLWLYLLLASAALTALYAALAVAFGDTPNNPTPPLASPGGQHTVLSVATGGSGPLVAVLAAIGVTGEFRHHTATATFLATPRRLPVILAKLVTYTLVGAAYSVVCIAVTLAIALPWMSAKGIDVPLVGNGNGVTMLSVVLAVALFGVIGVGLGAVLREQVATVVLILLYLFVVEPVVTRVPAFSDWSRFLPQAAETALVGVSQNNVELLGRVQGGVLFLAYAAVLAVAGTYLIRRRDVT